MSGWVLGVDGGNTKTHYALFDREGRSRAFLARGTASHEALAGGFDAMEEELRRSLVRLLGSAGLETGDLDAAVFGLAGADTPEQHREIAGRLDRFGMNRYRLVNDAFLGIKAGTESGVGVCSINGTGTVAAAVGPSGAMVQIGGHGFVSGDEGGGGFLAERVMRAVYDARFRCGAPTALTDLLLAEEGLADADELFHRWITGRVAPLKPSQAAFRAANAGDPVARDIVLAIGRNAAETVAGAVARAGFDPDGCIEVVLAGSLYVKADSRLLVDEFQHSVIRALGPRLRFRVLAEPPVAGAVLWALEDLEGPLGPELRRRVLTADWSASLTNPVT